MVRWRRTHLHDIVIDLHSYALHNTEVALQVTPTCVTVRHSVICGAVKKNACTGVVLHKVVVHERSVCQKKKGRYVQ